MIPKSISLYYLQVIMVSPACKGEHVGWGITNWGWIQTNLKFSLWVMTIPESGTSIFRSRSRSMQFQDASETRHLHGFIGWSDSQKHLLGLGPMNQLQTFYEEKHLKPCMHLSVWFHNAFYTAVSEFTLEASLGTSIGIQQSSWSLLKEIKLSFIEDFMHPFVSRKVQSAGCYF